MGTRASATPTYELARAPGLRHARCRRRAPGLTPRPPMSWHGSPGCTTPAVRLAEPVGSRYPVPAMSDSLGYRKYFGVVIPSVNTAAQPEFEAMRPPGITNQTARIHTPAIPLVDEVSFVTDRKSVV